MKKLLTVSVLAIMAVSAANAEIASTGYVDKQTGADANGAITYTNKNYINSATNLKAATESLDAAIKGVADTVSGLDNSGIADKIETALTEGKYVQEGDSLAVFNNTATGFVNAEGAVTAVEQAGYAKTANVVTNAELEDLEFSTTESGVVTSISQTAGQVAATVKKITDDEVDSISKGKITGLGALASKNTVTQAEVDGLSNALLGKQDRIDDLQAIRAGAALGATSLQDGDVATAITQDGEQGGKLATSGLVAEAIANSESNLSSELSDINDTLVAIPNTYATINYVNQEDDKIEAVIGSGFAAGEGNTVADQLGAVKTTADKAMNWAALQDASYTAAGCNAANAVCSLVSKGGAISWEKVAE